ncbi:hypothetical protein ACTFIY_003732 [Dictyostelium cf. discoideum]
MKSIQKIILFKILVILFISLIVLNISQHNEILKLKNNNNNNNKNNNHNDENKLNRELKVFIQNENEITIADGSSSKLIIENEENNKESNEESNTLQIEINKNNKDNVQINTNSASNDEINIHSNDDSLIVDFDYNVEFVKGDKPNYRLCHGCSKCSNHHNKKHIILF